MTEKRTITAMRTEHGRKYELAIVAFLELAVHLHLASAAELFLANGGYGSREIGVFEMASDDPRNVYIY